MRSAATLGGHFGLCARKPLQSDLALVLAAAGAQLQIMTIRGPQAGQLLHSGYSSNQPQWQQQQQQQLHGNWGGQGQQGWQQQCTEQQQHDLRWVSVEEYLASSCVGGDSSTSSICEITADSVAGASVVDVTSSQQQQPPRNTNNSSSASAHSTEVVTAVWLPYADDGSERFWSYKVALRHVNSHALVNAALWIKFDQSATALTTQGSSTGSCSSGDDGVQQITSLVDPRFAGARILSAKLFVGLPPGSHSSTGERNGSAAAAGSGSGGSSHGTEGDRDEEAWRITRVREVEKVLCGQAVDIQVTLADLFL